MSKSESNPNDELRNRSEFRWITWLDKKCVFEVWTFVIRHSDFGLSPPSLLRAQIECRSGILRRPRVPAALDAWHPGQFLPFERTVHGATRQRPARAGFLVFARSGLRRDVVGVESQFAIAELRVESDRGACRLIPEHD